jgi:hypothetical protein
MHGACSVIESANAINSVGVAAKPSAQKLIVGGADA